MVIAVHDDGNPDSRHNKASVDIVIIRLGSVVAHIFYSYANTI